MKKRFSLHARLLISASLVLAAFLGLTGMTLDKAFRKSAEAALQDRLEGQVYALLGAAELGEGGVLELPDSLPEPAYSSADSGLYARVIDRSGSVRWQSPSMVGLRIPFPPVTATGIREFTPLALPDGTQLRALSFSVVWEGEDAIEYGFTFHVAEDLAMLQAQISAFRTTLWIWLGGAALVLLAVQGTILRWSLRPLRQVAGELMDIDRGVRQRLEGNYPAELLRLTDSLNALLEKEHNQLRRYRDSLSDLAHSLKTPLAVIHNAVDGDGDEGALRDTIREQVARMNQLVEYRLGRAAAAGPSVLAAPRPIAPVIRKVVDTMDRMYRDRHITCEIQAGEDCLTDVEDGDLMEILGNLLDNAYKWSEGSVRVSAGNRLAEGKPGRVGLKLVVEDDGPGIPERLAEAVLQRGVRGDPNKDGHGIGLATVHDIVRHQGGSLAIGTSATGGARVTVRLP